MRTREGRREGLAGGFRATLRGSGRLRVIYSRPEWRTWLGTPALGDRLSQTSRHPHCRHCCLEAPCASSALIPCPLWPLPCRPVLHVARPSVWATIFLVAPLLSPLRVACHSRLAIRVFSAVLMVALALTLLCLGSPPFPLAVAPASLPRALCIARVSFTTPASCSDFFWLAGVCAAG